MQYQPLKKKSHSTKLTVVAIIILLGLGAYGYSSISFSQAQTNSNLTVTVEPTTLSSPFSPEQLALLAKIEAFKLDESLFKDPAFRSLQDWSVELVPEEVGKANPFAPLGGVQSDQPKQTSSGTRAATIKR